MSLGIVICPLCKLHRFLCLCGEPYVPFRDVDVAWLAEREQARAKAAA